MWGPRNITAVMVDRFRAAQATIKEFKRQLSKNGLDPG